MSWEVQSCSQMWQGGIQDAGSDEYLGLGWRRKTCTNIRQKDRNI